MSSEKTEISTPELPLLVRAAILFLKLCIIYFVAELGFHYFDSNIHLLKQDFRVWLFIYLPAVMGYETIISIIFSKSKK